MGKENDKNKFNANTDIVQTEKQITKALEKITITSTTPVVLQQTDTDKLVSGGSGVINKNPVPTTSNILTKPKTRSQALIQKAKMLPPPPPSQFNVCNYVQRYKDRQNQRMVKLEAEEKQNRMFQSKPAPKFSVHHKKIDEKFEEYRKAPVVPITPKVLRRGLKKREETQKKVFPFFFFLKNENYCIFPIKHRSKICNERCTNVLQLY